jgi:hypothetical protein
MLLRFLAFAVLLGGSSFEEAQAGWKRKCSVATASLAVGVTVPVGIFSAAQMISNAQHTGLPLDSSVIHFDGASITAGSGASLPLQMRLRDQFQRQAIDLQTYADAGQKFIFLLDYFYPSNFTELDHDDASFVEAEVRRIVQARLSEFDFVVLGLLPESKKLDTQKLQAAPENHPVRFVLNSLESSERTKRNAQIVNQTLKNLEREFPDQIRLADPTALSEKLLALTETDALAFFPDRIHPNDNGQAFFINEFLLPAVSDLPGFNQLKPIPYISSYQEALATANRVPGVRRLVTAHFADQAIRAQSKEEREFIERVPGLYWISIESSAWWGKNPFNSDTALRIPDNSATHFDRAISELSRIQAGISSLAPFMPSGFTIALIDREHGRSAVLNLTQALFYTSIELRETHEGSGIFEGWGYDFWSSQRENDDDPLEDSPRTNYYFRLSLDESNKTSARLTWWVLPMLQDESGQLRQATPVLRLGELPEEVRAELEKTHESMPRLVYEIPLRVR